MAKMKAQISAGYKKCNGQSKYSNLVYRTLVIKKNIKIKMFPLNNKD